MSFAVEAPAWTNAREGKDSLALGLAAASHENHSRPPGIAQGEPLGTQAHLRHRLLAGNVDRPVSDARQQGRRLDQERRLADTGIAADEQHRAAHESAADDAVKLGHAGGKPRRVVGVPRQRLEREYAALADRPAPRPGRGERAASRFLCESVPFAAGVALALPAVVGCTAVLADKARCVAAGHDRGVTRGDEPVKRSHCGTPRNAGWPHLF